MILMRVPYPMGYYAKGLDAPHRRSECRLEGPRPVERERRPHALAQRSWQGRAPDGRAHPGAARSAGALKFAAVEPKRPRCARPLACGARCTLRLNAAVRKNYVPLSSAYGLGRFATQTDTLASHTASREFMF